MTAQVMNRIHINGSYQPLLSAPEQMFWSRLGSRPPFVPESTANWSGYISHWAVREDTLYLTDIVGSVCRRRPEEGVAETRWCPVSHEGECDLQRLSLVDLCEVPFGGIPATWYSGELRIPQGQLVEYVHSGWASGYERDLILDVARGKVIAQKIGRIAANPWRRPESRWKRFLKLVARSVGSKFKR